MLPGRPSITLKQTKIQSGLSPWIYVLAAAVAAFFGLYMGEGGLVQSLSLVCAGLLCAAFGIGIGVHPCPNMNERHKMSVFKLILAAAAGLIISGTVHFNLIRTALHTGLPPENIVMIEGICAKDGVPVSDDLAVQQVVLHRVYDRQGRQASAGGTVTVFIRGCGNLYWGEGISVSGQFAPGRDDAGPVFWGEPANSAGAGNYPNPVLRLRAGILQQVLSKIRGSGGNSAGLFEAIFLGMKDDLSVLDRERFKKAGCTHILALSGMHLGVISGMLYLILRPLFGRRGSFWTAAVLMGVYIFITGMRSALLRAGIMFFLYGLGRVRNKDPDIRSIFLVTFLGLGVLTPGEAFTLSFQLSFLALGGILFVSDRIFQLFKGRIPSLIALPVSASLGAQAATAPVIAAVFGTMYPAGILASLIITPLITLFMGGGIIALLLPWEEGRTVFFQGLDILHGLMIRLLDLFGSIPGLVIGSSVIQKLLWLGPALILLVPFFSSFAHRKRFYTMLDNEYE